MPRPMPHRQTLATARPVRRLLLGLLLVATALAASAVPAAAASRPRLEGSFTVKGTTTSVHGFTDHKGDRFKNNTWVFKPSAKCGRFVGCDRIGLTRYTSLGTKRPPIVLKRTKSDNYAVTVKRVVKQDGCRLNDRYAIKVKVTASKQVGYALRVTKMSATFSERETGIAPCRFTGTETQASTGRRTDLPTPPKAGFAYESTDPADHHVITFTGNNASKYSWNFGDPSSGTQNSGTSREIRHRFTAFGTYTVTLTVTSQEGLQSTATKSVKVMDAPPTAAFDFAEDHGVVTFTDGSSDPDGEIVSTLWTFGDGATSTDQSPSHVYRAGGVYSVSLKVTDNEGVSSSVTRSVTVSANQLPSADFTANEYSPRAVSFSDQSSDPDGSLASWSWDFGDGQGSTEQSPNHAYGAPGDYTVRLTVTDDRGASATKSKTVTVAGP